MAQLVMDNEYDSHHFRGRSPPPDMVPPSPPPASQPSEPEDTSRMSPIFLTLIPIGGAVVFVMGMVIGMGTSSSPESAATITEFQEVEVERTIEVDPAEETLADIESQQEALQEQIDELDDRESTLNDRETGLDEREESLDTTETDIDANSIPGDGIYVVGEDIEAGTYQAQGSGNSCYFARLSSLDSFDIISNHFGTSNVSVEIQSSDVAFESTGCGNWIPR